MRIRNWFRRSPKPFPEMVACKVVCTCPGVPVQYEITLEDGRMIYARFRGGRFTINISEGKTGRIEDAVMGELIYYFNTSDPYDGHMQQAIFLNHLGMAGILIPSKLCKWSDLHDLFYDYTV